MSLLQARGVTVRDKRRPLLFPTTLEVESGELLVAYGDPGHGHTALALALAGRLEPDDGDVVLDGSHDRALLQRSVALVDVPGVSEPDDNVPLTTIVGEELAMAGRPAGRRHVRAWLDEHELGKHVGDRIEELPPGVRTEALARLAGLREGVRFIVLTLPERHGELPPGWLDTAESLAVEHELGVLVTASVGVARQLDVPTVALGGAVHQEDA